MTPIDCRKCLDAGVVEVIEGSFKTLAYCNCKRGHCWPWSLERIPVEGMRHEPLDYRQYKSTIGTGDYKEKINWHLERMRNAQEYWREWRKQNSAASENKARDL
jgi:hypothetical protein